MVSLQPENRLSLKIRIGSGLDLREKTQTSFESQSEISVKLTHV